LEIPTFVLQEASGGKPGGPSPDAGRGTEPGPTRQGRRGRSVDAEDRLPARVESYVQQIVLGAALVFAIVVDQFRLRYMGQLSTE